MEAGRDVVGELGDTDRVEALGVKDVEGQAVALGVSGLCRADPESLRSATATGHHIPVRSSTADARSIGHAWNWLPVRALDVKQNPPFVRPITLGRVQQLPVHALKVGEPLPNAAHKGCHPLRLWAL